MCTDPALNDSNWEGVTGSRLCDRGFSSNRPPLSMRGKVDNQEGELRRETYSAEAGKTRPSALCLSDYGSFAWSKVSSADLHVVENTFG
jgi:hypothetical protein